MQERGPWDEVVVAVCTFQRPEQLAELLTALELQVNIALPSVVVVDNDGRGSARLVAESFSFVRYVIEPRRGIATARNTSVREALALRPWAVAFIDDDEVPEPDWLHRLSVALVESDAQAVTGPVIYDVSAHPATSIVTDQYIRTRQRPTGEIVKYVATNNTLVRAEWLTLFSFDTEFDLTGGSDLDFFLRFQLAGGTCRWVSEARVVTHVPAERLTASWNLRREMRNGQLMSRLRMRFEGATRMEVAGEGLRRIGRGLAIFASRVLRPGRRPLRGPLWVADGVGWLRVATGILFEEYAVDRSESPAAVRTVDLDPKL